MELAFLAIVITAIVGVIVYRSRPRQWPGGKRKPFDFRADPAPNAKRDGSEPKTFLAAYSEYSHSFGDGDGGGDGGGGGGD